MDKLKITVKGATYLVSTLPPHLKEAWKDLIEKARKKRETLLSVKSVDENKKQPKIKEGF